MVSGVLLALSFLPMALPRILVFDDMAGWLKDYRARLCRRLLLHDATEGEASEDEHSCLAEAVFHPAQVREGNRIENSIEAALAIVREGIEHPKEKRWALILLDLQFDAGEVPRPDAPLDLNADNWPTGAADPQFGLRLLEGFARQYPDPKRPGRTALPVAVLARTHDLGVEGALNNLGNLGYIRTSVKEETGSAERRRLSELLFHFGLFPDGPACLVDSNGKLKRLVRDSPILGDSLALLHALRDARQAAASLAPCLLQGPIGSGKGVFARFVHDLSSRRLGPFKQEDCASLPENLLELELFGYVADAALQNQNKKGRRGAFELAQQGTLFLDEIGAMTSVNQAKLLVTLQEGQLSKIGAENEIDLDVRVLAATHLDLEAEINKEDSRFNHVLYSRLHSLVIRVPSLNERRQDIPLLFQSFVESATKDIRGETSKVYPEETLQILKDKNWRFNVRQLENLAKRIAVERKYSRVIAPNDVR